MSESSNGSNPGPVATNWSLARTDMDIRAALLAAIDDGRFSCESGARAAGVGSNMIRSWRHRRRKAVASQVLRKGFQMSATSTQETFLERDCEAMERAELEGLPGILARAIKTASSGREAKAGADALATVLDLRRRAHGLPSSLDKRVSASPKVPVFLCGGQIVRPKQLALPQKPVIELQPIAQPNASSCLLSRLPPSLQAAMAELPEWQRNL